MITQLYCVQIVENSLGPAGRLVHSHRDYSPNGVPHLIVDTYDNIANKSIPKKMIHAIVEYVPSDEPIIDVANWFDGHKMDREESVR